MKPKPLQLDKDPTRDLRYFHKRFGHLSLAQQRRIRLAVQRRAIEIVKRERGWKREKEIDRVIEEEKEKRTGRWPREKFSSEIKPVLSSHIPLNKQEMAKIQDEIIFRTLKKRKPRLPLTPNELVKVVRAEIRFFTRAWLAQMKSPELIDKNFLNAMYKMNTEFQTNVSRLLQNHGSLGSLVEKQADHFMELPLTREQQAALIQYIQALDRFTKPYQSH